MASARDPGHPDAPLTAEAIATRDFSAARRGYDQDEVRRYLQLVGRELAGLERRRIVAESRLSELENKLHNPDLSEEAVVAALGEEMAATLRSAHQSASELRKRAAEEAERVVTEAKQSADADREDAARRLEEAGAEAERRLAEAAETAQQRVSEATAEAENQRQAARAEAERIESEAKEEAERIVAAAREEAERHRTEISTATEQWVAAAKRDATSEAQQIIGRARADAETIRQQNEREQRETIDAANALRDRVLTELARRRRVATIQIEQLRAGRERLIDSYALVRRTLEEVQEELARADAEARAAADAAGVAAAEDDFSGDLVTELWGEAPEGSPGVGAGAAAHQLPPVPGGGGGAGVGGGGQGAGGQGGGGQGTGAEVDAPSFVTNSAVDQPGGAFGGVAGLERVRVISVGSGGPMAARQPAPANEPIAHQPEPPTPAGSHLRIVPPAGSEPAPGTVGAIEMPAAAEEDETSGASEADVVEVVEAVEAAEVVEVVAEEDAVVEDGPAVAEEPAVGADSAGGEAEVDESETDVVAEPEVEADPEVEAGEPPSGNDAVESLFARIRQGRQQAVDQARDVLDAGDDDAETEDEPESSPAAEVEEPVAEEEAETGGDGDDESVHSDADERLLQDRDAAVVDLERDLNRRLKRALQDEQNDLLDRLRGAKGTPKPEDLLGDPAAQVAGYAAAARPALVKLAAAGAKIGGGWLTAAGGKPSRRKVADDRVSEQADHIASEVAEPLRRRLVEIFAEQAGEGAEVLTESLGAAYRSVRSHRIEAIASDAVIATFNLGAWTAWPDGTPLRWIAEDLDGPCPDCDDNTLAGGVPKGEPFPTGQPHPPAHEGCRCLVVPDQSS